MAGSGPKDWAKRAAAGLPHGVNVNARRVAFFGTAHTCPLCGSRIRLYRDCGGDAPVVEEMRVVGGMLRVADKCPVCSGLDRTRLTMLFFERELLPSNGHLSVLHLAPEHGLYLYLSRQEGLDYVMGDLEPSRYKFAKGIRECDITQLPFEDACFDVLIASHILEHIPDDHKALTEIGRVLRPGGRALLMTPISLDLDRTLEDPTVTDEAERERLFGQHDHVRLYASDFGDRIAGAGLTVEEFRAADQGDGTIERLKLNPLETLYVGQRVIR